MACFCLCLVSCLFLVLCSCPSSILSFSSFVFFPFPTCLVFVLVLYLFLSCACLCPCPLLPCFYPCFNNTNACFDQLFAKALDVVAKALALSSPIPHAGDWLHAVPSSALGLHLHEREFRFCLQYWLGVPMVENGSKCPVCSVDTDAFRDHHIRCRENGDLIHRHDFLRDAYLPPYSLRPWAQGRCGNLYAVFNNDVHVLRMCSWNALDCGFFCV